MNKRPIQFDAYIPGIGLILKDAAISLGMCQLIVSPEELQELLKDKFKFEESEGIVYSLIAEEGEEEGKYENIMEFLVGDDWFFLEEEKFHMLQHTGVFYPQEPERPIVEGDIAKYYNRIGVITYDEERMMFLLKSLDGTLVDFCIRINLTHLEYIGNVFVNPELNK